MRLLVTGSRDWADAEWIRRELEDVLASFPHNWRASKLPTLIHGGNGINADGSYRTTPSLEADAIADRWWRRWGYPVDMYRAKWDELGRSAGPTRNRLMVATGDADLCLAFIRDGSRGATGCARLAEEHGIPVLYFRRDSAPALVEVVHR